MTSSAQAYLTASTGCCMCSSVEASPLLSSKSLARVTSSAVPWTMSRNLSAFNAASYFNTLSLGMPML